MAGRGSIRERDNGTFRVRVYLGKIDGKRKYRSQTAYSKSEAQELLTEMLYEIDNGTALTSSSSNHTVKTWCLAWLEGKKRKLTQGTFKDYHTRLKLDVFPMIGHMKVKDLIPNDCEQVFSRMDGRGLSQRTQQYTYMILNQALKAAKANKLAHQNPMESVERPTVHKEDKVQKIAVWSREEVEKFLRANEGTRHHPLWLMLLTTGLRPSEALALEWRHIDFDAKTIKVEQGLSRLPDFSYEIGGLKTANSHRVVPMPEKLEGPLKAHRAALRGSQLASGARTDLVFPNKAWGIQDVSRIRSHWKRACKRAGLSVIRLYDARHTFATRLLDAGVNPKLAAEIMGHASTQMFLDVYTHLTEQDKKDAAATVQKALFG